MAGPRHRHRRAEERVVAATADAYRDLELAALAAVAEAVLADLRSTVLAIRALVGPVGADLYGANLAHADLARADLPGADLTRAILLGADLAGADLTRAILVGADLQGTDLTRANLVRANLYGATLVRANLYDANLTNADLRGAILTRAILTGADLHHAILTRADLYGADLVGADLTHADLREANLHDAALAQVLWSSGTLWPEVKAPLMRDRSEELRPGVWRVFGSGHADAETEDPLVSVLYRS
ncbi:MAG: pentapeptide repeat-containing protein [Streptosporangiaceae bacterium]